MGLLERIKKPEDLRAMSREELENLASEIRELIIEVVSENGGHLASNLGVVELTIALHCAYNFFEDRLLFDVSHQCYTHKLLTGRADRFRTIRKKGGLSGFQNRFESEADPFTVGHAGSILSAAAGMAAGDALAGRKRRVVAVVGDAGMASGNNFEALNHVGALGRNLLVVLNDNKMAIAETVGALSNYLTKVRLAPVYTDIKKDIYEFLNRVPVIGKTMNRGLEHLREIMRRAMVHGLMFEDLGFHYYGPIDGHDINGLLEALDEAKRMEGPVLLHVVTEKGRGFKPAADDPEKFHGAQGFLGEDGKVRLTAPPDEKPNYTTAFGEALIEIGRKDERVVAVTAAMPEGTGIFMFKKEFPDRFVDVGICEQHATGFAAGLATSGLKPVAAIYSTFLQRAFDQVVEQVALQKVGVVFAIDRAGLVGSDGPTHHGMFDVACLRIVPGMVLMAPRDAGELAKMLDLALTLDKPSAIRYPRADCPAADFFPSPAPLEIGKAEVLRKGGGVCVLAYGSMVAEAESAARLLEKEGLKIGLVNARFAKPIDGKLVTELAGGYEHLLTVEEGILAGGFGSAVMETLRETGGPVQKLRRLGLADGFVEQGTRSELLDLAGLSAVRIAETIRKLAAVEKKP